MPSEAEVEAAARALWVLDCVEHIGYAPSPWDSINNAEGCETYITQAHACLLAAEAELERDQAVIDRTSGFWCWAKLACIKDGWEVARVNDYGVWFTAVDGPLDIKMCDVGDRIELPSQYAAPSKEDQVNV